MTGSEHRKLYEELGEKRFTEVDLNAEAATVLLVAVGLMVALLTFVFFTLQV